MIEIFKDNNYIVIQNKTTGKFSYGLRKYMRDDADFIPQHTEQTRETVLSQIRYRQEHSKFFWYSEFEIVPKHIRSVWDSEDKIIKLLNV